MRSFIYYIVALLVVSILPGCDTDSTVEPRFEDYFIKYYGEGGNQTGVSGLALEDGFVLLGTSVPISTVSKMFLVRTDELGNKMWSLEFGGNSTTARDIVRDNSGNFIVAANLILSQNDTDVLLMKVDPMGAVLDSVTYGAADAIDIANHLTITQSGEIIVVGSTTAVDTSKPGYNSTTDLEDIFSVKTDGDLVAVADADWRKIYGFEGIERGENIIEKSDGSFLFFGTTDRPPSDEQKDGFNMFLFPAAADGIAISDTELQLFGTISNEVASHMVKTADGGFVMVGTTSANNQNDIFLTRVRSNNQFLSSGAINSGNNLLGISITESRTGGLLVLGEQLNNNNSDIYLAKTSVTGAIIWQESFGGADNDHAGKVIELEDGSIMIIGTVELESQTKMSLVKTNRSGQLKP